MKLFAVYLGGSAPGSNTELHDVVFVAGEQIADTYEDLLTQWFGTPDSLHIDSWLELSQVDGHHITLSRTAPTGPQRLFFVNLGAYRQGEFAELHANTFLVATSHDEAKARAKQALLRGLDSVHTDDLYDVDDCLEIGQVAGLHVQLEANGEPSRLDPVNGWHPLPAERVAAWLDARRSTTSPADADGDARRFVDGISAGYQDAIILLAANHLGVFTALGGGPRTAPELARDLGCDARALDLVLCALVAARLLERPTPSQFALPARLAPLLLPDGAQSMHAILDHHHHLLARWVQLAGVVQRGSPAPDAAGPRDGRSLRAFICGMKDISRRSSEEVADALPALRRSRRLLDLGGGPGTAAITFCRRWPQLEAVVFDLPEVVPIAAEEIAAANLGDRITTRAGDYHHDPLRDAREPEFDVVYVSNIIHSLSLDETLALLEKAVGALSPGGLLVLKDFFLEDSRTEPAFGARFAVNMLVGTEGGKSYTWTETEELCRALGLVEPTRHRVASHSGLVTARRPA